MANAFKTVGARDAYAPKVITEITETETTVVINQTVQAYFWRKGAFVDLPQRPITLIKRADLTVRQLIAQAILEEEAAARRARPITYGFLDAAEDIAA